MTKRGGSYDVDDLDPGSANSYRLAMEKKAGEAEHLGVEVAKDRAILEQLIPELLSSSANLWAFGMGLAKGSADPRAVWNLLLDAISSAEPKPRDFGLLCGMIFQWNRSVPDFANELLDEALEKPPIAAYFPIIQSAVTLDARGIKRLFRSLELGHTPTHIYHNLALGRTTDQVPAVDLARFILALAQASDGLNVALHILGMQFFCDKSDKKVHAPELIRAGQKLLTEFRFDQKDQQEDFELQQVVTACLGGKDGYDIATVVCDNLKRSVANHQTHGFDHNHLIRGLFDVQPMATLDALLTGDGKSSALGIEILDEISQLQPNPMGQVAESALLEWSARDATARFPIIASSAPIFHMSGGDRNPIGWTPFAITLIQASPDPVAVMRAYAARLRPTSWSGSRATILEANANLLRNWDAAGDVGLKAFVETAQADLMAEAKAEREWENKRNSARDERFE